VIAVNNKGRDKTPKGPEGPPPQQKCILWH